MILRLGSHCESLRPVLDAWPLHFYRLYSAEPRQSKHEYLKPKELLKSLRDAAVAVGWESTSLASNRLELRQQGSTHRFESAVNWIGDNPDDPEKSVRNLKTLGQLTSESTMTINRLLFAVVWRNSSIEAEDVYHRVKPFYEAVELDVVAWAGTRQNGSKGDAYSCFLLGECANALGTPPRG